MTLKRQSKTGMDWAIDDIKTAGSMKLAAWKTSSSSARHMDSLLYELAGRVLTI